MIFYESSNCAISIAFNFDTQRKRRKEGKKRKNLKLLFFHFPIESHKVLGEFELAYIITKRKEKKAEMI